MSGAELYTSVTEIVKAKNTKIAESLTDDAILLGIKEVEQAIKNYCQIPEIPKALIYTHANIVIDLLLYQIESNTTPDNVIDAFDPSDISNIKIGDTSFTLGDKYRNNQRSRILQSHNSNLDSLVMNYKSQLNQFRRIW